MVSRSSDSVQLCFNSLKAVKAPIELSFQKAAKDVEACLCIYNNGLYIDDMELNVGKERSTVQFFSIGKRLMDGFAADGVRKKQLFLIVPTYSFLRLLPPHYGNKLELARRRRGAVERPMKKEESTVNWPMLIGRCFQAFLAPDKSGKKTAQKGGDEHNDKAWMSSRQDVSVSFEIKETDMKGQFVRTSQNKDAECEVGSPLKCLIGSKFDQLVHTIQTFNQGLHGDESNKYSCNVLSEKGHFKGVGVPDGRKVDVGESLRSLMFAKVGGGSLTVVEVPSVKEEEEDGVPSANQEAIGDNSKHEITAGMLDVPLSNAERFSSTLSTVSSTEHIEHVPQLGRSLQDYPDKSKLFVVQDFFTYTESEGRRLFEELDRDGDGQVTLADLEVATERRKLPKKYAQELMQRNRPNIFSKSFGWKQFLSFMKEKEPTILRAYTSFCISQSGTLQKSEIMASLKQAGLPASEDNAVAMLRFLNSDSKESVSYARFRNFMLLLPSERLRDDPRNIWFEAAIVAAVAPIVEIPSGSVLKSALAGGISCSFSAAMMHPIDTVKTQVQASTLSLQQIISMIPQIGYQGLYRGSIPAILGQFSSHGLRTGICEASKLVLIHTAPSLPELQVQSMSSLCGTVLGTVARIPCEVLKQRLQAGIFYNVGDALIGTWKKEGLKGFFSGTGATLCREIPFYVAGMGLYTESKKGVEKLLRRELEPWEAVLVGAISGGLASVTTTPFDVIKTRMMTNPGGPSVSMTTVALSILRHEGPLGLFKGVVPRFFWVAPLGAMNLAGYELLRKTMEKRN